MSRILCYACLVLLASCLPVWGSLSAVGNGKEITVYLFSVKGCPHCLEERKFLSKLERKYANLRVVEIDLTERKENQEVFQKVSALLKVEPLGVPFTVVGNIPIMGWYDETLTGSAIERALQEAQQRDLPDVTGPLLRQSLPAVPTEGIQIPEKITVPVFGELEIKRLSLGLLTIIFGALDGFNPCAMWALVFLIGLLINMQNRKKMWALGILFIAGSGFIYFLFMSAWLNIFLFVGLITWIRVGVGAVALAAAVVNLKEYFTQREASCPLGGEKRQSWRARIRKAVEQQSFLLAAAGVFLLGVAVNLVELFCSLGLPVVYTQILTLSRLPAWQYYAYLALYILIFMLDDILVFTVSMLTLQQLGLGLRYQRFSNLIGGITLLVVGLLLIFKPEFLMFA
jgi:glutaredoxin|uniref:Glutaredoxin n=1 Tax=Desulfobacca acetoxidans TaxID=60893 RepID=A0A7C3WHP7_9BACT